MWRVVRRIGRVLAWIALSALLFVLVAVTTLILWARSPSGRRILLARGVAIAQRQLGGRLTVDALEGDLTREIALRRIRIYDREHRLAVAVDRVRLEYDLFGLLARRLRIRALAVEGARARVGRLPPGQLLLSALQQKTAPLEAPSNAAPERRPGRGFDVLVESLRVDAELILDLATSRPPLHARVAATGGLDWRNESLAFHDLRARSRLDGPLLSPLAATVRVDGPAHDIVAELLVLPAAGELRAQLNASLTRGRPFAWHATLRSRDLDPAAILPGAPHGRIELAASARGTERTARIDVDELALDAADSHASLRGFVDLAPRLTADLRAEARSPELSRLIGFALPALHGSVDAHAHLMRTPARTDLGAALKGRRLRIDTLDLATLDGNAYLEERDGRIVARARLDAAGPRHFIADLRAHGVQLRDESAWAVDLTLDRLAVGERDRSWRLTEPGRLRIDSRAIAGALALSAGEQTLTLEATIDRQGGPLAVSLHGRHLDVSAPARLARIQLPQTAIDVDTEVHGTPAAPALQAKVRGRTLPWPRHELPSIVFALDATGDGRRLYLTANASAGSQNVHATIAAPFSLAAAAPLAGDVRATGVRLEPLRRLLPPSLRALSGATDFSARLSGTTRAPELVADLTAGWTLGASGHHLFANLTYRNARLAARWDTRIGTSSGALHGELAVGVDLARARYRRLDDLLRTAPLKSRLRGHGIDLAELPIAPPGASPGLHAGQLDLALDVGGTVLAPEARFHAAARGVVVSTVDGIDVTVDGAYVRRQATLTIDGTIHHQPVLAVRAESRFAVDDLLRGHEVPVTADATVPSFDLSRLGHFAGVIEATASVRGTLAHPTMHSELRGRNLQLSELRFATLDAHATWDGAALTATLDGRQPSGGTLHLDGALPAAADATMHATFRAESFSFAINDVGGVRRLEGALAANLRIGGSRSQPRLDGSLRIDHGAFAGGNDPRLFHDLTLRIEANHDTIELRELALHAGRGAITAHGRVTLAGLEPATIDMVAEAERFPFDAANSEAWVNATIELHGRKVGQRLEGKLTLSQGRAELPALERRKNLQSTAPLEDVIYVDVPAPEPTPAKTPPELEVIAHIPGPFTVDSPELHAQLRGELEVRTVDGELGVFGHAETMAGRFEILGREYEIEHARASFNGDLDPVVDLRLTRVLGDTKLIIAVHGTAAAPQLELASDPPVYNPSQVLGLVMSSDPDNRRVYSSTTERQVAGAVSGVLVNKLKGSLVSGLPLDVIQIDPTAADEVTRVSGARVELGKYLRKNIYVGYIHHFGATVTDIHRSNTHEVKFEYRIRRRMVLGVRYGDAGIGAIDFAWTVRY